MSYDIAVEKTEAKEVTETLLELSYTYNVSPMYYKALGKKGINGLHLKRTGNCIDILEKGIKNMEQNSIEYKKLNPANGWGNFEGALEVLKELLGACKAEPNGIIRIS